MDFTQKIGPFPAYAWGGVIGLIVVGVMYWQNLNGDSGVGSDTADNTDVGTGSEYDAIDGAFEPGTANGNASSGTSVTETMDTNEAWRIRAVASLVSSGTMPLTAQRALTKYLNGESLNPTEEALVNKAISAIGSPPEGIDMSSSTPASYSRYIRTADGSIYGISGDGSRNRITLSEYINMGMPAFSSNQYEVKNHRTASNGTTVAAIASKYGTTVENIQVLNRWKTVPDLKKGQKVKVPAIRTGS